MPEYNLKPGKIGQAAIDAYKEVEEKFTDAFLEKDPACENPPTLKVGKIGQAAIDTYQKIENAVVGTYQKIEDTVVGEYKRVENGFVNAFLTEKKPEEQETGDAPDAADGGQKEETV